MIVDIAPQQQLSEVFLPTMTNGYRHTNELGKKAELILGHAPAVVDYRRQFSVDFVNQNPLRLNIPDTKTRVVNDQQKVRQNVTVEQLVPLIFKVVQPVNYSKIPERISNRTNEEMETKLNLSDDDDDDDDENEEENLHFDADLENDGESNRVDLNNFSLQSFLPTITHSPPPPPPPPPASAPTILKRKEDLVRSFSSSVNTPIDIKQPKLPITIPTYLFFEQNKSSKRDINGSMKYESNIDTIESLSSSIPQQKKSKTSHANSFSIDIKDEPHVPFHNDLSTATTLAPVTVQTKKEKPTANVKPLLQSSILDNSLASNMNANVVNPPANGSTTTTRVNYANLRNKSTKELNSLAREKKKQADGEKRTFDDIKQSMALYLESVCYFIQCANDEPIIEQRYSLLKATLNMLQHLTKNYQKMFQLPANQDMDLLNNIRPKFLLINYWLQSYIYHLQFNTNFSSIEPCATQLIESMSQSKSPSSISSNSLYDFAKLMINSYQSNFYWQKAERLIREEPCRRFLEQLTRQTSPRRLSRDDPTLDFLLYIFEAIELLRLTSNQNL